MRPNSVSSLTLIITSQNFSIAVHGVYAEGTGFETCYRPSLREFYRFFFLLPFLKIFSLKICHKWSTIWSTKKKTYISLCIFCIFWVCGTYSLLWTFCCNCFQSLLTGRGTQMDLFLKISVLQKKNFLAGWCGRNDMSLQGKCRWENNNSGCLGDFMCRIAAMGYLS